MAPTIYPDSRADAQALARTLLDAAGPGGHEQVQTSTDGPAGIAFVIPEDLYTQVIASGGTASLPVWPEPDQRAAEPRGDAQAANDGAPEDAESTVAEPPGEPGQPGAVADVDETVSAGHGAAGADPAPVRARRRSR